MPVRKGDLSTTTVPAILTDLAESAATGCLRITDLDGDEATVYLRDGAVYAAGVPSRRPQLGARLMTSGALPPSALSEALEAQRSELQGWRLGELLVHLGYVEAAVVEAFVTEQLRECCWDLSHWRTGRWRFRAGDKTRDDIAQPVPVVELLAEVDRREREWIAMASTVHGVLAVPRLASDGAATEKLVVDGDAWSLLASVDGDRTIAELARDCGFTLFEAAQVVHRLVRSGLLEVDGESPAEPAAVGLDELLEDIDARVVDRDPATLTATLITALETTPARRRAIEPDLAELVCPVEADEDPTQSLSRVSAALADLLGPSPSTADPFEMAARPQTPVGEGAARSAHEQAADDRRLRMRAQSAAALATMQAEAEAQKADVVDLAAVREREQDRREAQRAEAERAEAERSETEQLETERLETERAEAERAEAERAEAVQHAAQEAARAAAEQIAAEEAARAEAERVDAERLAAEDADRIEAERRAADEAARVEAARAEVERIEVARIETERIETERIETERIETEQIADEPVVRLEPAEADAYPPLTVDEADPIAPATYVDPFFDGNRDDRADTAALLRELSSLGDPDPQPDRPTPPARPTGIPMQPRKRKGRFGF